MLGTHYLDQDTAKSSHCNIHQVPNREPCCLEVDPNYRSELEIDEQEEDVPEARVALGRDPDENGSRRPNSGRANGEQTQEMKCVDQETANRIGGVFHVAMKITRGSAEPARCSLFRLIVLGAQCATMPLPDRYIAGAAQYWSEEMALWQNCRN
jgi:hypothetical protein